MTPVNRLSSLKGDHLKYVAFLMGLPNSGAKAQLAATIQRRLSGPPALEDGGRIVSVDMGIRNLGVCVLEKSRTVTPEAGEKLHLKIVDWKKTDVLAQSALSVNNSISTLEMTAPSVISRTKTSKPVIDPQAFRPRNLSKTAVGIAQQLLHSYKPSHILIERQRFRSGGASAVQEWTLRVNMLESMLWASFETLRRGFDHVDPFPEMHEVSPERVARFWSDGAMGGGLTNFETLLLETPFNDPAHESTAATAKKHVDKKEKIALVRSWLSRESMNSTTDISLELSDEAREVANAFVSARNPRTRHASNTLASESGPSKLDDLADSLLQGVAWVRWAENHCRLRKVFENEI